MGKILLIVILIGYILYKLGSSVKVHTTSSNHQRPNPNHYKPSGGNVNVDAAPKEKKRSGFKGGEYVDFEEIK